jgi:hypothetical protein
LNGRQGFTLLEGHFGAPFDREERYQELTRRQGEIEEMLNLTKNQAPSQAAFSAMPTAWLAGL